MALTLRALGGLTTAEVGARVPGLRAGDGAADRARQAQDRGRRASATRSRATPTCRRGCAACWRRSTWSSTPATARRCAPSCARRRSGSARVLVALMPDEPRGDRPARADAACRTRAATPRVDADGRLVLLADQDRSRWDAAAIAEGERLVARGWRLGRLGPYLVQASIAVEHSRGSDWARIVWLYDQLLARLPDADRRPQPRRRDRRARRPGGRPGADGRRSRTSTATTSSTPPAPTSCAASSAATRRPPPTATRWR